MDILSICILLVLTKLLSSLVSSVYPFALAEAGRAEYEQTYSSAYEISEIIVIVINIVWVFTQSGRSPNNWYVILATFTMVPMGLFSYDPTIKNMDHGYVYYFIILNQVVHGCSVRVIEYYLICKSLHHLIPRTGIRQLGSFILSLIKISYAYSFEDKSGTPESCTDLIAIVAFSTIMITCTTFALNNTQCRLPGEKGAPKSTDNYVSARTAGIFAIVCIIGLNGEQIMDHMLSLKIRHIQAYEGDSSLAVLNEVVRGGAALAVFITYLFSFKRVSFFGPKTMISAWALCQFLRLVIFGASFDIQSSSPAVVVSLILLDKYTAGLGEIALEQSLMQYLLSSSSSSSSFLSIPFLMSASLAIEQITGSGVKVFTRYMFSSSSPEYKNNGLLMWIGVLASVIFIAAFVFKVSARFPGTKKEIPMR